MNEIQEFENKDDRIFILELALNEARSTIEFLHNCLMKDGYQYAYPEQTLRVLDELNTLVPPRQMCFHSGFEENCNACVERRDIHIRLTEIKARSNKQG